MSNKYLLNLISVAEFSPVSNTTAYLGATGLVTNSNVGARILIPHAGVLKGFQVKVGVTGAGGSIELVKHYIRLGNVDVGPVNLAYTANFQEASIYSFDAPIALPTYLSAKMVFPAWVSNPTNVFFGFSVLIEAA